MLKALARAPSHRWTEAADSVPIAASHRWRVLSPALVALGVGASARSISAARPGTRAGAALRSRSVLAEAAAEPLGARARRSASASTRSDHVWIVHRADTLDRRTKSAPTRIRRPATCCAPAPPVLEFDPAGQPRRRTGAARPRATSGRRRTTASPSTTRTTSGSAATATSDSHILKFTQRRQVPRCRSARPGRRNGQQRHRELRPRRQDLRRSARRTRRTSPTATATSASPCIDADTGKFKRYWGAYGNKPDDTNLGRYDPNAPPAQQFRTPVHCAEPVERRPASTSATARTIASRSSRTDGTFVKEAFIAQEDARRRLGVGHRVLEGPAAEVHLPRRRQERAASTCIDREHAARS